MNKEKQYCNSCYKRKNGVVRVNNSNRCPECLDGKKDGATDVVKRTLENLSQDEIGCEGASQMGICDCGNFDVLIKGKCFECMFDSEEAKRDVKVKGNIAPSKNNSTGVDRIDLIAAAANKRIENNC